MKKLIFFLIIFTLQIFAQGSFRSFSFEPVFFLEAMNKISNEDGKTKLDFFFQMPYSNLQFVKSEQIFKANYQYEIVIYDEEEDNLIHSEIWEEIVSADSYESTIAENNNYFSHKSINLAPAKYYLKIVAEDLESNKSFQREFYLEAKEFNSGFSVSDILLIEGRAPNGAYIPNIEKVLSSDVSNIEIYFEITSDSLNKFIQTTEIYNPENDLLTTETDTITKNSLTQPLLSKINLPSLELGKYKLLFKLKNSINNLIYKSEKTFTSKIAGIPKSISDIELAIRQCQYIANVDELDYMESAETFNEKIKRFKTFWKSKDPSPNTSFNEIFVEYFRRVEFAEKNFKGNPPGWRSDMGMIYITLGKPSYVERQPFNAGRKPYEIWQYYNINTRFLFIDETGFGDYRLQNTNSYDWSRFRY